MSAHDYYFIKCNGLWEEHYQAVKDKGFDRAEPLERLVYSCEIGDGINQHCTEDLKSVSATIAVLKDELRAWRNAYFSLEWDETTGECLLGCGGDSAEGHGGGCIWLEKLPDNKLDKIK